MYKLFQKGVVLSFVVFIMSGLIFTFLPPYNTFSSMEGRSLQVVDPKDITEKALFSGSLFQKMESMSEDQFPFRSTWVSTYAKTQLLLGKKSIKNKAIGKEHYVAIVHSGQISDVETSQLRHLNEKCEQLDTPFYYAVAPTKDYVIKDLLPDYLAYPGPDVFVGIHKALDGFMTWIDLSKPIVEANRTTPQYYKTDHHWNHEGFFTAYATIAQQLFDDGVIQETPHGFEAYEWDIHKSMFLGSEGRAVTRAVATQMDDIGTYKPRFPSELTMVNIKGESLDIINLAFITSQVYDNDYGCFLSGTDLYAKITNPLRKGKPKALVVGISYTPPVVGLLAEHFSELTYVDLRKYKEKSLYDLIDTEKPDVVLIVYYSGVFSEDMYTFDVIHQVVPKN